MENQVPRKRQQRKACDVCRRRKVRCDILDNDPCSTCRKSRIECRSTAGWVTPRKRGYAHAASRTEVNKQSSVAKEVNTTPTQSISPPQTHQVISDKWRDLDSLARSGLARFIQVGVDSMDWLVFDEPERYRVAYIGTSVSNLSHLVALKHPSMFALHYPYPPIRPPLPWKPENGIWGLNGNTDIAQDISCFPAKEIRDHLIDAFFDKIHPGFPIIDEAKFRAQYANSETPPPLLLFQAILLAGAHVCDHPLVADSRLIVKGILFRRANMLFHIRHENDRLHLIQAALLFTWHLDDADTVSGGSYYWLGIACRIGYGMGLHRALTAPQVRDMPCLDRRIFRRIWWTVFQNEVFSSLEHGRPCMVNLQDVDQLPLEQDDFLEGPELTLNAKVEFEYCVRNIELCIIILDVLQLNNQTQHNCLKTDVDSVNSRLALWAMKLPPEDHSFWDCQLRMHYNLVLLQLHRNYLNPELSAELAQDSRDICGDATEAIVKVFDRMISQGTIGQCYFTAVMALTAAGIHISKELKAALRKRATLRAVNAQSRLSHLLNCTQELAAYWPNAEAVSKVFEAIHKDSEAILAKDVAGNQRSPQSETFTRPILDWQTTLGSFTFPQQLSSLEQEWMNISCEMDV